MAAHAFLSPSAAHRWLHCTAAPRIEAELPDNAGKAAAEGTLAHAICEAYVLAAHSNFKCGLPLEVDPKHAEIFFRERNPGFGPTEHAVERLAFEYHVWEAHELYSPEMLDHAAAYAAEVMRVFGEVHEFCNDPELHVEVKTTLDDFLPDGACFGTIDCCIIADQELHIIDFKYGKGVEVSAEENPQMMIYGCGALAEYDGVYDIKTVHLHIFQPRIGNYSSWSIPAAELWHWGNTVLHKAALQALGKDPDKLEAGTWCKFCRAKAQCKTLAKHCTDVSGECKGAELMSVEEVAALLPKLKTIKEWADAVEEHALNTALEGTKVPGYKLVEGRSLRKIVDPEGFVNTCVLNGVDAAGLYKPKELLTITGLEKVLGKKRFAELSEGCVEKPAGKPTLVPESDKRKEISALKNALADDDFSEFNN